MRCHLRRPVTDAQSWNFPYTITFLLYTLAFPAEHANVTGHLVLQAPSDASRPPSSTTLAFIPDHKNGATVSLDINDILELKKADGAGKFTKQAFELIAGSFCVLAS